jgi:hypothetical protein
VEGRNRQGQREQQSTIRDRESTIRDRESTIKDREGTIEERESACLETPRDSPRTSIAEALTGKPAPMWAASTANLVARSQGSNRLMLRLKAAALACDRFLNMFEPHGLRLRAFRLVIRATHVYAAVIVPIQAAFAPAGLDPHASPIREINILVDLLCVSDVLVKARTGFFDRGRYVGVRFGETRTCAACGLADVLIGFPLPRRIRG